MQRENARQAEARSNEGSAAKPDRTGLPNQLKASIEALSGVSMDRVKVHYNSSQPAQLNALAYARGRDIHIASGQERHLPHEAWHVVQQAHGRVGATMQTENGVPVNTDLTLEREADVMGAKAAAAIAQPDGERIGNRGLIDTAHDSGIAQRKMGFEFETARNKFIENAQTHKQFDRKDVAYNNGRVRLEGDSGYHLEFVTAPYDNWPALQQAIRDAEGVADDLERRAQQSRDKEVTVGTAEGFEEDNISMKIGDANFAASVQSTEGVELSNISGLINEHLSKHREATTIHNNANDVIDQARRQLNIGLQDTVDPSVFGLIKAIVMYVNRAQAHDGTSKDGPKAGFRLMARTDFRSMYKALDDSQRLQFKAVLFGKGNARNADAQNNPITQGTGVNLDQRLFKYGYKDEGSQAPQRRIVGPILRDWLASIATAASGTDGLSPPPGYTPHSQLQRADTKLRYGMGAMKMDNNLALFEMRGYRNLFGRKTKNNWETFARARYDLAAARNNSLHPRQQQAPQPQAPQQHTSHSTMTQPMAPIQAPPQQPQQIIQQLQQQVVAMLPPPQQQQQQQQPEPRGIKRSHNRL